jgi:ATP-dependent protease HslVU (ClpYQ) peptidase subunit
VTCIVGLKYKDNTYIGGDSVAISAGDLSICSETVEKVFWNRELLIGAAGSLRWAQTLRYTFIPPKHPKSMDDMSYIVRDVIDAMADQCKPRCQDTDWELLIAYRNGLYGITPDFSVREIEEFDSIGCGAAYALGALFTTVGKEPVRRIQQALTASAKYNASVREPFVILTA